jgi:RNA 2',3'-cyclic 3'-phosphodiesterase
MSVRLFAGVALPEGARAALARYRDAAADPAVWRRLDAATFHVTLAFIGHRPEEEVERTIAALAAVPRHGRVALRIGGPLLLPPRRPRVLAAALEDPGGVLAALHADVAAALAAAAVYEPGQRAFRPHVTVARLLPRARAARTPAAAPEPLAFDGGALTLYRSHPRRGGATYEVLFARAA